MGGACIVTLRKDLIEAVNVDNERTPYVLECHQPGDLFSQWRTYTGLWNCRNDSDARTRALSIFDSMSEEKFRAYDGWRVVRVLSYAPEVSE